MSNSIIDVIFSLGLFHKTLQGQRCNKNFRTFLPLSIKSPFYPLSKLSKYVPKQAPSKNEINRRTYLLEESCKNCHK